VGSQETRALDTNKERHMNFASSAYRIVSIGYESNVKAYKASWETTEKGKKYHSITAHGIDSVLVYADIVLISYADTLSSYVQMVEWYKSCTGKTRIAAKATRPEGTLARISKLRVYWYPTDSYGYDQQNIGMYQLLSGIKVPDSETEKFRALLDRGSKEPAIAFKILSKIKSMHDAKHPIEGHLTALLFTVHAHSIGRTIVSGIKPGTSYRWLAGAGHNRSKNKWVEDIHGKAIDLYLDYVDSQKGSDMLSMDSLYDDVEDKPSDTVSDKSVDTLSTNNVDIVASMWDLNNNFEYLKLPDGTTIDAKDPRWDEMCKVYRIQEENKTNKER
jgi:hypothetical protein